MGYTSYKFKTWEELEQFLEEAKAKGYHWGGESELFDGLAFLSKSEFFSLEESSLNLWRDGEITYQPVEEGNPKKYIPGELPEHKGGNHEG